jgi:hypothetical protein
MQSKMSQKSDQWIEQRLRKIYAAEIPQIPCAEFMSRFFGRYGDLPSEIMEFLHSVDEVSHDLGYFWSEILCCNPHTSGSLRGYIDLLTKMLAPIPSHSSQTPYIRISKHYATAHDHNRSSFESHRFSIGFQIPLPALREAVVMLTHSDHRPFVPIVLFELDGGQPGDVTFFLMDRRGLMQANFNLYKEPALFLRLIATLMYNDKASVGYDAAFTTTEDLRRYISIGSVQYMILQRLASIDNQVRRGTECWRVLSPQNEVFVVKQWTHTSNPGRCPPEDLILRELNEVEGIPKCLYSENAYDYSWLRGDHDGETTTTIIRMLLTPCAHPIESFGSQQELLYIFYDIINGSPSHYCK